MDRATALAVAAVLVAIIGFSLIYSGISSLKAQLEEANKRIASLQDEVQSLKESSKTYATTNQLTDIQASIEEISKTIDVLKSSILTAASQDDIKRIAVHILKLEERLEEIEKLAGEDLQSQIQNLTVRLQDLRKNLEEIAQKIEFPVVITDATGEQVIIPAEPTRIVSLAPAVTETIYFIGGLDKLVGIDEYSNYPPQILEMVENGTLDTIGGFWTPSIEKILALNPDLVVGVDAPPHLQVKQILKDYGIPVIILPQDSIDDVRESIIMLGMALGSLDEAVNVLSEMNDILALVKLAASNVQQPVRVALIVWINPIFVAGNDTFQSDIIEFAGGINAFGNLTGWPVVSVEDLVEARPDVIILSNINVTDFMSFIVSQIGDSALSIPAILNKRVYTISGEYTDMLSRPSPRIAQIIPLIQYIMYPELYGATVQDIPQVITPDTLSPPTAPRGLGKG